MNRIAVLAAMMGVLILAFGLSGQRALETPQTAEAVDTTWTWPPGASGYQVLGGDALENTEFGLPPVCTNCYITRIEPDLIYLGDPSHTDGTPANFNQSNTLDGAWNHHFAVVDSCNPANRVITAGNERTILQYPAGYGYFQAAGSPPGCKWVLNYHIHNSGINTRTIAIRLNVTYQTTALAAATPVWLDVSTAANSEYTVPTGYSDTHTGDAGMHADYTMSTQGKIIGMGGHVHDYGYSVSAFNTGAGDRPDDWICTSVSGYGSGSRYLPAGGPGTPGHPATANGQTLVSAYHQPASPDNAYHIQNMTPCTSITERMSVICVGDVIKLHSQYNTPLPPGGFPIPDAMGIMVMYMATPPQVPNADGDAAWDGCDSGDSDLDGYSDRVEVPVGTLANDSCGTNAWPADINNDNVSDISDLTALAGSFSLSVPPAPARRNIAPNPVDLFIDITDIVNIAGRFGDSCTP